jgi:hypothetical protein
MKKLLYLVLVLIAGTATNGGASLPSTVQPDPPAATTSAASGSRLECALEADRVPMSRASEPTVRLAQFSPGVACRMSCGISQGQCIRSCGATCPAPPASACAPLIACQAGCTWAYNDCISRCP